MKYNVKFTHSFKKSYKKLKQKDKDLLFEVIERLANDENLEEKTTTTHLRANGKIIENAIFKMRRSRLS